MSIKKIALLALGLTIGSPYVANAALIKFQDQYGSSGYSGTLDAELIENSSDHGHGSSSSLSIDGNDGGGETQALIRFSDIFGGGSEQIASGSTIISATLGLQIHSPGDDIDMLRMLVDWDESTASWDSLGNGIQNDGTEAAWVRRLTLLDNSNVIDEETVYTIDVTAEVQLWANGTNNYGWGFTPTGNNGVDFHTSEHPNDDHVRPYLEVNYITNQVPTPPTLALFFFGLMGLLLKHKPRFRS